MKTRVWTKTVSLLTAAALILLTACSTPGEDVSSDPSTEPSAADTSSAPQPETEYYFVGDKVYSPDGRFFLADYGYSENSAFEKFGVFREDGENVTLLLNSARDFEDVDTRTGCYLDSSALYTVNRECMRRYDLESEDVRGSVQTFPLEGIKAEKGTTVNILTYHDGTLFIRVFTGAYDSEETSDLKLYGINAETGELSPAKALDLPESYRKFDVDAALAQIKEHTGLDGDTPVLFVETSVDIDGTIGEIYLETQSEEPYAIFIPSAGVVDFWEIDAPTVSDGAPIGLETFFRKLADVALDGTFFCDGVREYYVTYNSDEPAGRDAEGFQEAVEELAGMEYSKARTQYILVEPLASDFEPMLDCLTLIEVR